MGDVYWVSMHTKLPERSFRENPWFNWLAVDMFDSDQKDHGGQCTMESEPKISSLPLALLFSMFTSFDTMLAIIYPHVSNLREL